MRRTDCKNMVKAGDTVRIVPVDMFPNATRKFTVYKLTEEGFLYGVSTTCDGYVMPYSWIKSLKVIKRR